MTEALRLLCVLAHPDDESLGLGGVLARYAAEGVATYVVTATRGERGRLGTTRPGAAVLAPIRERELNEAAGVLGVREVRFLDYLDGEVDRADPAEAVTRIAGHVRALRPQVVITFGADGAYGHPDHIAVSQLTAAAVVAAAADSDETSPDPHALPPHRVSKLYWMVWSQHSWASYRDVFGELQAAVDGEVRRPMPWPSWMVTTVIDTSAHAATAWRAVRCHASQIAGRLASLPEERALALWSASEFYRVFSLANGGRELETDLFAGLR